VLKLPPPIWTVLFLILTAGANYLAGWPTVSTAHSLSVGIALIAVSFIAPVWALILFRSEDTQVSSTSETNNKLITSGPFRFTRNPMYLGLLILSVGVALATGAILMFIVPLLVFATANWVHIPFEEAKMRRQFGQSFDAYTREVRRWI
jgi:protein-S-isoprenylcysteine O-methyltransferase Ste14